MKFSHVFFDTNCLMSLENYKFYKTVVPLWKDMYRNNTDKGSTPVAYKVMRREQPAGDKQGVACNIQ